MKAVSSGPAGISLSRVGRCPISVVGTPLHTQPGWQAIWASLGTQGNRSTSKFSLQRRSSSPASSSMIILMTRTQPGERMTRFIAEVVGWVNIAICCHHSLTTHLTATFTLFLHHSPDLTSFDPIFISQEILTISCDITDFYKR